MANIALAQTLYFVTIDCYKCGVTFAVSSDLHSNWRRDKTQFFCPNGHGQSYTEGTAERLQRELDAQKRETEWQKSRATALEKQLTAQRGVTTKLRRRIGAGVCPCCQRTFKQLAAHMKTKHPNYEAEATSKTRIG